MTYAYSYDAVCVERDRLQRRLNAMIACVKAVERSIKDVISALEREGGKLTGPIEFELRSAAKFAFGIHHDAENR